MRELIDEVRRDGDAAVLRLTERFDGAELAPEQLRVAPAEVDAAIGVLAPDVLDGLRAAIANVKRGGGGPAARAGDGRLRGGPPRRGGRGAGAPRRASTCRPGKAPYPSTVVMGAVTARAAGVGRGRGVRAAGPGRRGEPGDPRRLRAVRGRRGLPDGRRAGDRRAGVRHGVREGGGRDRGPRQRLGAGGQAAGGRARWASTASPAPASWWWSPPPGADPELIALDLLAQAEHGAGQHAGGDRHRAGRCSTRVVERAGRASKAVLADDARAALAAGRGDGARAPRAGRAPRPRRWPARCAARAACSWAATAATAFGDYIAGSNHILPTGGRRAVPVGAVRVHVPAPDGSRIVRRGRGSAPGPVRRGPRPGRGLPRPRRVHGAPRVTRSADIQRTTNETDIRLSLALDGDGSGERSTGRRLLRPPARRAGPPRRAWTSTWRSKGDLETGAAPHGGGHRHRARPRARRGARTTAPASAATATPWCRWTRRARPARST